MVPSKRKSLFSHAINNHMDVINGYTLFVSKRCVNSKKIFTAVNECIFLRLQRATLIGDNNNFVLANITRLLAELFEDLRVTGKVETFQVVCDARNNGKRFLSCKGFIAITVRYRQAHCLNMTELKYETYHK